MICLKIQFSSSTHWLSDHWRGQLVLVIYNSISLHKLHKIKLAED